MGRDDDRHQGQPIEPRQREKTALYQLVVSAPLLRCGALPWASTSQNAVGSGDRGIRLPGCVGGHVSFVIWFALVLRYSANRLSAFTFLTPLFGVAAGHLVLNEPVTPAFAVAVAFVGLGLVLVNRAR